MPEQRNDEENRSGSISKLIQVGSEIKGGAAASVIGFFAGGPIGAAVGGAASPMITHTLKKIGTEIQERLLGQREEVRIGATFTFAIVKIQEKLENGHQPRQDGFFEQKLHKRSPAEEILEGVLLAAQREHEEKKLQFYGNLIANLAFHAEIGRAQANLLTRLGKRISYCQMCLLVLFVNKDNLRLRQDNYQNFRDIGEARLSILQEIYDLYSQRLLDLTFPGTPLGRSLPRIEDLQPARIEVTGLGKTLYSLMEFKKVDRQDLSEIIQLLLDNPYLPSPLPMQVPPPA